MNMLDKRFKHKNSMGVFILRILFGLVLFDEKNILLKKQTQKFPFLPHYLERLVELMKLYPMNIKELKNIISKFGYPTSEDYKYNFNKVFIEVDPSKLFNSYKEQDPVYVTRLMLTYNRIDFIQPYLDIVKKESITTILDYGCGVADIGIFLSQKYKKVVDLVDLDLPKVKFAQKRFMWRGLKANIFPVNTTEKLASIEKKYDLIIATEIIEHFRYPIKMINWFYEHLNDRGLLLLSIGRNFVRERGGDHLNESFDEGNSSQFKKLFDEKFVEYRNFSTLFIKKSS